MTDLRTVLTQLKKDRPLTMARRRRRITVTILLLILIEAAVWVISYFSTRGFGAALYVMGGVLGLLLPLILVHPWKVFRHRYMGTIIKTELQTRRIRRAGQAAGARSMTTMTDALFVIYTVACPNGDRQKFELPSPYTVAYAEGDTVVVLSGLPAPVNLTPHEQNPCPACGALNPGERNRCMECREQMDRLSSEGE